MELIIKGTPKELAALVVQVHGHREPKNAEATLRAALIRLINKKEGLNEQ